MNDKSPIYKGQNCFELNLNEIDYQLTEEVKNDSSDW